MARSLRLGGMARTRADLRGVLRCAQCRVTEQGADRGQPGVAGGDGVGPSGLQVLQERGDQRGV